MTSIRMRPLLQRSVSTNGASQSDSLGSSMPQSRRSLAPLAGEHSASVSSPPVITYSLLIAQQDWAAVREALSTEEGRHNVQSELTVPDTDGGVLHFACRFHPPVDVVASMASHFPGAVRNTDRMGRCPLHIAAKWGAFPEVIKFLIEEYPDAAGFQDAMGKTPLHLACESYASKYSSRKNGGRPLKDAMVEVVRRLCRAAPDSVNLEDMDDMTALEYAIDADVDLKVVRSIQKACEKDWKHRRELPGTSHEAVREGLLQQSQRNSQRLRRNLLQQRVASGRDLMSEVTQTAEGMSLSPAFCAAEKDLKGHLESLQPALMQHQPRKKPTTRALMA